jgi:hypothetical protein
MGSFVLLNFFRVESRGTRNRHLVYKSITINMTSCTKGLVLTRSGPKVHLRKMLGTLELYYLIFLSVVYKINL